MKLSLLLLMFIFSFSYAATDLDFKNLRQIVENEYNPIFISELGSPLKIELDEDSPNYVGGIDFRNGIYSIQLGSDFEKEEGITIDSYAAILCHEIGHALGGLPKKINSSNGEISWSSTEAQSDYFSSTICLKKIFKLLPSENSNLMIPENIRKDCELAFTKSNSDDDKKICMRTAQAGYELMTYLFQLFSKYGGPQKYNYKPELTQKELSNESSKNLYPNLQCRLDTIVAGALCVEQKNDFQDGFCEKAEGYTIGLRPSCWYVD